MIGVRRWNAGCSESVLQEKNGLAWESENEDECKEGIRREL